MTATLPIAAIHTDSGAGDVLVAFARELADQGVRVRGLILRHDPDMHLVDLLSGQVFAITQDLGADSEACRIDPSGFAEASQVLRQALAEPADLVVVNRFGKLEAAGGGFAAEMLAVMAEGVPVLTCVGPDQQESWQIFTGGAATALPPDLEAVRRWWRGLSLSS